MDDIPGVNYIHRNYGCYIVSLDTSLLDQPTLLSGIDLESIVFGWQRQRASTPDAIAIVSEGEPWTYDEVESLVDTIARRLIEAGIGPQDRVGLCVDRSVEAIASMLAVFKIKAVFVPLDPEYPVDRIAYMVNDAQVQVIFGHRRYRTLMSDTLIGGNASESNEISNRESTCRQWIVCEELMESHQLEGGRPLEWADCSGSDLAYIMYTSGSTGKPKGVQINHHALAVYCDADIDVYKLTAEDRTLQFSTLCFDIAIEEIFPPLLTGGSVVIRPRDRAQDRNELSAIVDRFGVTAIHLATAYWHQWVDLMVATNAKVPKSIRLMIVTGEKVSVEHYRRWQSICEQEVLWCNAYGPTEATVSATVFIPDDSFDSPNMPIGKPLKHYDAYVLDPDFNSLPPGETGALFLGGPALAVGYLNRPELTDAAFLTVKVDGIERRIYRTGDLARWMPDGNIDFAGRVDHQIKLGSYRIEPGEIEAAIDGVPGVQGSLVSYDEIDGKKYLIAYVAHGSRRIDIDDLARRLRLALPVYMIPSRYVMLESFPKTINGKIDRRALPPASTGIVPGSDDYVAPRTDLERKLAEIWQEVLNLPQIGIHDDFFAFGGSSLLVVQVISRLTTDLHLELPVRDFFANPTIAASAAHLQRLLSPACESQNDLNESALQARNRLPLATPMFYPSDQETLFGVHYRPRGNSLGRSVVLAHSISHEYTRGYANMQKLAVQLCSHGFDVFRFDYASTGNSSGECSELTVATMTTNLVDSIELLQSITNNTSTSIVGLRLGATIASHLPTELVDQVILWDPVVSGREFIQLLERFHTQELTGLFRFNSIRTSKIDQLGGHRMSPQKRLSIESLHLNSACPSAKVVLTQSPEQTPAERSWLATQTQVQHVEDSILWNDTRFTTSAFSSRNSIQAIIELLSNPTDRGQL